MGESTQRLAVAGKNVPFTEALQVILGYCLGESYPEGKWRMPDNGVGKATFSLEPIGAFAYRIYDCVPPSPGRGIETIDVLVADGLNAQMYERDIHGALSVAEAVSACLADIDDETTFWDLRPEEVTEPPTNEAERAWPIWRAWTLLMGAPQISVARAHKVLHHKRPRVFPLVDNETMKRLRPQPWGAIHRDLTANPPGWEELEKRVGSDLKAAGGIALTRLRLHDILVWCDVRGKWRAAMDKGKEHVRLS